jgi:hypothetical protein
MVACISIRFYLLIAFLLFLLLCSLGMRFGGFYCRVHQNETHTRRRFTKLIIYSVPFYLLACAVSSRVPRTLTLYWRADPTLPAKSIDHLF